MGFTPESSVKIINADIGRRGQHHGFNKKDSPTLDSRDTSSCGVLQRRMGELGSQSPECFIGIVGLLRRRRWTNVLAGSCHAGGGVRGRIFRRRNQSRTTLAGHLSRFTFKTPGRCRRRSRCTSRNDACNHRLVGDPQRHRLVDSVLPDSLACLESRKTHTQSRLISSNRSVASDPGVLGSR